MTNLLSKISAWWNTAWNWSKMHKWITGIIIIVLIFGIYEVVHAINNKVGPTTYVLSTVTKGTVISTISGTGQVAASNNVNLSAQASGLITYVGVKSGDTVHRGQTLFSIDAKSAQKSVRDAEISLQSAQLGMAQLQQAPDTASVLQIKNSIADAENSKTNAQKAVDDAYRALLNSSTSAFTNDLGNSQTPPTISGTYQKKEEGQISISVHEGGSATFFTVTSIPADIVNTTGVVSSTMAEPIGDTGLYIKFPTTTFTNQPDWIISLPNKAAANYAANKTAYDNALSNQQTTNASADNAIAIQNANLDLLYKPDPLSVQAKQLSITQAENSLEDAKANLADYYVSAPFDGTIATVTGQLGQTASGTLATIVTKQNLATITLNEVDVSKIKVGNKATLTFDALPDLSVTGEVAEIDPVGTVSQGVVDYNVKISMDTDESTVKPGMSVTADIITDIAQDVLTVPASAVKSNATGSYVLMFNPALPTADTESATGITSATPPVQVAVETGITDDTSTEITSGLKEGDQIVSRTIAGTTTAKKTTTTPSATSLLGGASGGTRALTGGAGGGFGATRTTGR